MKFPYLILASFLLLIGNIQLLAQSNSSGGIPCYELSENIAICQGSLYTFPDGTMQTINAQVIHVSNLQTVESQCDSIIETTVNVLPSYNLSETNFNVCTGQNYTFPDGSVQFITEHTEYTSYLQTVGSGCDSIIETVLNTTDILLSVTVNGDNLSSNQVNAGYQWVDCDDNFAPISGQSNQSFMAPAGNFAVIIFKGGCSDTSACIQIMTVGIDDTQAQKINVYPNPSNGRFQVDLGSISGEIDMKIRNAMGQTIKTQSLQNISLFETYFEGEAGIYYVELQDSKGACFGFKFLKE